MLRRLPVPVIAVSLLAAVGAFAACSTETIVKQSAAAPDPGTDDGSDAGTDPVDAAPAVDAAKPVPKAGLDFPHVVSRGGPSQATPRIVPIFFLGDSLKSQIITFTANIARSDFWKTNGEEYGVGPATAGTAITVDEQAPSETTDTDIETWLRGKLTGSNPAFGTPDPNTLYAIYYPASTNIVDNGDGNGASCVQYGGYHSDLVINGKSIGYAVMPRCSDTDYLTVAASHEYFEWATDPFPMSQPAWNKLDDAHYAWQVTMLGELGDLCTFLDQENLRPAEIGFEVQRMWSNKASVAGQYPCAPAKTAPYFQAITAAEDPVQVTDNGDINQAQLVTKGIKIAPGGSRTVDMFIYSDQAGKPSVPLRALSQADFGGTGNASGFTYELSDKNPNVGDTVQVTITAPTKPGSDILVMAAMNGAKSANYWPVLVFNDATAARATSPTAARLLKRTLKTTKLGLASDTWKPIFRATAP